MRRRVVILALAALVAGCGGGSHAAKLADAKPCLSKLALVVPNKRFRNQTIDADNVDVSYGASSPGATAAHLTFYGHAKDAKAQLELANHAIAAGTVRFPTRPQLVGGNVVVTWSSPPAPAQKQKLVACLH